MNYNESQIRAHYRALTELLIEKKLTITTMESATSGQIASLITDTEGSSAVLKGAFITYSNEAKIQQGVPAEIIDRYSVYSTQTAEAMAIACMRAYHADIGIGVTGTMGNVDPANPEASVPGQVYFAIAVRRSAEGKISAGNLCAGESGAGKISAGNLCAGESGAGKTDGKEKEQNAVPKAIQMTVLSFHTELAPQPSRLMYKLAVAEEVYRALISVLI